eukprot:CAMPEP_0172908052 /NCGR_PEP_ID=MMETSP1075-20121228/180007_1 /TAXON_ID=2916 /ORGANISM="Ceratium fusus, Strain PA161109" /LENGTH=49 /DNA_ID=CAMNT_0013765761 /DNA_START=26 /DNA_END=175 /DNA_ORIENTATION=-
MNNKSQGNTGPASTSCDHKKRGGCDCSHVGKEPPVAPMASVQVQAPTSQ